MKKVAILTDSTAYLPQNFVDQHEISSVPLVVIWEQETFEDNVTITPTEFYSRLKTAKIMPSTSQPSVGKMQSVMTSLLTQGYDVMGIFISSKLSGTVQSAMQARDLLPKGSQVEIFDSESTTIAMGFQVLAAARAAADGASLSECRAVAEKARQQSGVYFMVDTLEFLYRGGRIGGAQRFLGTALNLKPILFMQQGKIEALERVRTKGKALDRLIELVAEKCDGGTPVRLASAHANSPVEAQALLDKAGELLSPIESITCELSPVVGTHVGPGTLALAYMTGM
ncbi:MAG: DegV family protein [Chloroflexi bacterium]|nr:DegV family protein [Chloroflexota bacterium]